MMWSKENIESVVTAAVLINKALRDVGGRQKIHERGKNTSFL